MSARRLNQFLYATAAIVLAGAAAVLALGLTLPLDNTGGDPSRGAAPVAVADTALPPLASLEPIWDLRLRGELTPAPAPQQPARLASDVAPAPQGIPVSLVGTVGDSLAILRQESGQVEVRAAGETVAGVEVLDVRPARVRVRYNGQELTLEKPPPDERPGL